MISAEEAMNIVIQFLFMEAVIMAISRINLSVYERDNWIFSAISSFVFGMVYFDICGFIMVSLLF